MSSAVAKFTPEELEELAAFDEEVDDDQITLEEWLQSTELDRTLKFCDSDAKKKRKLEVNRKSYHRNKEKYKVTKREWRARNAEHIKAYNKIYRQANLEERRQYDRTYHVAHREERNAKARQYKADHKEEIRAKYNDWYEKNKADRAAYYAEWWQKNKDAYNAKRRQKYAERKAKANA